MKRMKRVLCLLLCLAMAFPLAACSKEEGQQGGSDVNQPGEEKNPAENNDGSADKEGEPADGDAELSEEEAMKLEPAYGTELHYMMGSGCTAGPAVAELKGYYEELGLNVKGVKADSDVEALGTGQVEINVGHIAKQFVPATNGVDIVFVGGAHSGCKTLFVLADSPYQTLEDLKGTKVSTPNGIGKSDYNITARLFIADGIDPLNDVELTPVENDACVPAMQNGEISAALLSDTYAWSMVNDGLLRPIRSMLDEDLNQLCCVITMNGTFVKNNPIHAKKLVEAVKKAHRWMADNVEEATDFMLENNLNSGDRQMNIDQNDKQQFGPDDSFAESQLRLIAEDYLEYGLMTTTDDVDTIMEKYWMPLAPEA